MESLDILLEYLHDLDSYFRIWINKIVTQYVEMQKTTLNESLACYKMKNIFEKLRTVGFSIDNNKVWG